MEKFRILYDLYKKNLLFKFLLIHWKLFKEDQAKKAFLIELFDMSLSTAICNLKEKEWQRIKNLSSKEKNNNKQK